MMAAARAVIRENRCSPQIVAERHSEKHQHERASKRRPFQQGASRMPVRVAIPNDSPDA
jgi:hypothetical protein